MHIVCLVVHGWGVRLQHDAALAAALQVLRFCWDTEDARQSGMCVMFACNDIQGMGCVFDIYVCCCMISTWAGCLYPHGWRLQSTQVDITPHPCGYHTPPMWISHPTHWISHPTHVDITPHPWSDYSCAVHVMKLVPLLSNRHLQYTRRMSFTFVIV
jgi:hypothetical protein